MKYREYEVTVIPSSGYINDGPCTVIVRAGSRAEAIRSVRASVSLERTRADGPVKYTARVVSRG